MDPKEASRAIFDLMEAALPDQVPAVRTWDGDCWGPADAPATLVLQHPGALRAMLLPPTDLVAGEAYIYDDIDIEGDIVWLMGFGAAAAEQLAKPLTAVKLLNLLRRLPADARRKEAPRPQLSGRRHTRRRDREAIESHYDIGNDFYEVFLDAEMSYTCAYFLDPAESLNAAQARKHDLVLRKLRLQPGARYLDVGCGWGSMLIRAARDYGAVATGVTLSEEQAEYARQAAKEAGFDDRIKVLVRDYRDLDGEYDAISAVGMFEHVGRAKHAAYFEKLRSLVAPGGALLNHSISQRNRPKPGLRLPTIHRPTFVSTYVFPDGELVPVETTIETAERAGFEVRDAEALRANYPLTLRHWIANLENNRDAALAAGDDRLYRIFRLYMAGAVAAFEMEAFSVYQLLCVDPGAPWAHGRAWATAADDVRSSTSATAPVQG